MTFVELSVNYWDVSVVQFQGITCQSNCELYCLSFLGCPVDYICFSPENMNIDYCLNVGLLI